MAVYQVSALQLYLGQELRNIFYYETADVLSSTQRQELADSIRTDWAALNTSQGLSNNWQLYGVAIRRVDVAGFLGVEMGFTSGALTGSATDDSYATQIAALVFGRAETTRPNQVRSYLGGLTESWITDAGTLHSAIPAILVTWAGAMAVHALTGDDAVRVSAQWAAPDATHVVDWNVITDYSVSSVPGTQRRRRIGRGI